MDVKLRGNCMASEFGKKLKALRERKDLTQEGLARTANLSLSFVARLEQSDSVDPSWSTVQALAAALGVTCEAFAGTGVSQPATDKAAEVRAPAPGRTSAAGKPKGKK